MPSNTFRSFMLRLNQRPWFTALALIVLVVALGVAFFNVFAYSREGSLQAFIGVVRIGLVFTVVLIWVILNLPPPRVVSSSFIVAFNEFGEETAPEQAERGSIRASSRRNALGAALDDVRRLPAGRRPVNETGTDGPQTRALAVRDSVALGASADAGGNLVQRGPTRPLSINKNHDLNTLSGRISARRAEAAQNEVPNGGRATGLFVRQEVAAYVGAFLKDMIASDPHISPSDVSVAGAGFAANDATARKNAQTVAAALTVWGWTPFDTEGVFVPAFEVVRSFEEARAPQGQMQLMGLRSFRLGRQQVRYPTMIAAFLAGLSAYSLRRYDLARNELNFALVAAYLHGGSNSRRTDGALDCAVIYFYLGNVESYRNDFDAAARAYTNALRFNPQMVEARHNMGVALYLQGQAESAVKTFIAVVRDAPDMAEGRYSLGLTYVDRDQFASARRELNRAKQLNPTFPPVYRALAYAYRREARTFIETNGGASLTPENRAVHARLFEEARANLREALRLKPDYIDAQVDQALLSYEQALILDKADPGRSRLLELAQEDLNHALALAPTLPDTHYHLGLILLAQERTDEAVEALREAIRLRPNFDAAHLKLGQIYQVRGQRDLAERQFSFVHNKETTAGKSAQDSLSLGIGARVEKRYDQAGEHFMNALRLEPRNAEVTLQLGILYQEMGELDRAEQLYRDTTRLDPTQVESYYRYSTLLRQRGQERQAFDLVQRIALQYPTNAKAHYYLANAFRSQRQLDRAAESYSNAIKLDPGMAEARYNLAALSMSRKQYNEAVIQLTQVVSLRPDDTDAYVLLADAYRGRNDVDLAIDALSVAVAKKPEDVKAHIALGRIQLDISDPDAAVSELETVLRYDPGNVAARELLGKAYAATQQYGPAIETLQSLLLTQPDNFTAHYNLGLIYRSLRRYAEAEGAFLQALAINGRDLQTYYNLGIVYREEDKIERAVGAFRQVNALDPEFADAYNILGQIYMSINEVDKGRAAFETYGRLKRAGR